MKLVPYNNRHDTNEANVKSIESRHRCFSLTVRDVLCALRAILAAGNEFITSVAR